MSIAMLLETACGDDFRDPASAPAGGEIESLAAAPGTPQAAARGRTFLDHENHRRRFDGMFPLIARLWGCTAQRRRFVPPQRASEQGMNDGPECKGEGRQRGRGWLLALAVSLVLWALLIWGIRALL